MQLFLVPVMYDRIGRNKYSFLGGELNFFEQNEEEGEGRKHIIV